MGRRTRKGRIGAAAAALTAVVAGVAFAASAGAKPADVGNSPSRAAPTSNAAPTSHAEASAASSTADPSFASPTDPADADLAAYRARRTAELTRDDGWLTLVGLLWMKPGDNTFGRGKRNALVLDHPLLPERAGTFHVRDGRATFTPAKGSGLTVNGAPVTGTVEIADDRHPPATLFERGTLQFYVIERAGRLLVRARDRASPRVLGFAGLQYFPVSKDWRFEARWEPYEPVHRIPIMNVLGYEDSMVSPGAIVFEKGGHEFRLDAIRLKPDDRTLFVMFSDGTTGHETYGAGRFLYVPLPHDGRIAVDFNRAINPPCAFNMFATCPLPPAQNRLAVRIEAGELKYAGEH